MAKQHFLAGVGRALLFKGNDLIGVAKTLTESTFDFSITAEDVRGGQGNGLLGRYFHDSNMQVTLVDAMFDLQYMALSLGVNLESGGLSVKEEELAVGTDGTVTASETPAAFNGSMIGWYKKPSDTEWSIGTFTGSKMSISGASQNDAYCVKYFYINENAKSIKIKSQYVPAELHVVIMNDIYSGDVGTQSDVTKYGRLITDIPSFQLDGNMDLNLAATSVATVSLTGNALGVESGDSCEEEPYYGTMTEEIFGANWKDDVVALAIENADIELANSATETLIVRAVYGGAVASARIDNSNLTFAVQSGDSAAVAAATGVITADGTKKGDTVVSATLTGYPDVVAYATVTVA